jgi:hypothetical protein
MYYLKIRLEEVKKSAKNISHDSLPLVSKSNLELDEHEAGMPNYYAANTPSGTHTKLIFLAEHLYRQLHCRFSFVSVA